MKIRKLQLKNIGVFDDETIEFQPCPSGDKAEIHIFTGQNGSGKSTILKVLAGFFDDVEEGGILDFEHIPYIRNSLYKRFRLFGFHNEDYLSKAVATFLDNDSCTLYGCGFCKSIHQKPFNTHNLSESSLKKVDSFRFFMASNPPDAEFEFAAFAFSGYRQIENERVEAIKEPKEFNPLLQALNFVKDYNQSNELTINQLITNNISKSAIEKGRNEEKSKKFANVLKSIQQAISEITGWNVEFDLETEPIKLITKVNGEELDFDVLPDGLRSLISWIADLLGRVDLLKWQDDSPITEKNLILLLDEIEVHLHPAWQRKVLPVVQKLFKNSQIFVSTHSPFVVNSVDGAWVYELKLRDGKAQVAEKSLTKTSFSYQTVLREVFDIEERFGEKTQITLEDFLKKSRLIQQANGNSNINKDDFLALAQNLANQSAELQSLVFLELARLSKETGEPYEI